MKEFIGMAKQFKSAQALHATMSMGAHAPKKG